MCPRHSSSRPDFTSSRTIAAFALFAVFGLLGCARAATVTTEYAEDWSAAPTVAAVPLAREVRVVRYTALPGASPSYYVDGATDGELSGGHAWDLPMPTRTITSDQGALSNPELAQARMFWSAEDTREAYAKRVRLIDNWASSTGSSPGAVNSMLLPPLSA